MERSRFWCGVTGFKNIIEQIPSSRNWVRIPYTAKLGAFLTERSQLWSECNYRISENTDISTVYWQSARGIHPNIWAVLFLQIYVCRKFAVEFYSRMGYTMGERS